MTVSYLANPNSKQLSKQPTKSSQLRKIHYKTHEHLIIRLNTEKMLNISI